MIPCGNTHFTIADVDSTYRIVRCSYLSSILNFTNLISIVCAALINQMQLSWSSRLPAYKGRRSFPLLVLNVPPQPVQGKYRFFSIP